MAVGRQQHGWEENDPHPEAGQAEEGLHGTWPAPDLPDSHGEDVDQQENGREAQKRESMWWLGMLSPFTLSMRTAAPAWGPWPVAMIVPVDRSVVRSGTGRSF